MSGDKVTHTAKTGSPDSDLALDTVFTDTLALYKRMRTDLVDTIAEAVAYDVIARSRPYRKDRLCIINLSTDI